MMRKLIALIGIFALCFSMMAVPAAADDPAPSSSAEACAEAGAVAGGIGIFTAGTPETVETPGVVKVTTTVDSCVVTSVTTEEVPTGHRNFRVDFEVTTVTVYTTTTVAVENWQVVGQEEVEVVQGWGCLNNGGQVVQNTVWGTGYEEDPSEGAPVAILSHPNCGPAFDSFPNPTSSQPRFVIAQVVTVEFVDVYDWVSAGDPTVTDSSEVLSITEEVIGCFNLVSNGYLDDINNHCQTVIDNR